MHVRAITESLKQRRDHHLEPLGSRATSAATVQERFIPLESGDSRLPRTLLMQTAQSGSPPNRSELRRQKRRARRQLRPAEQQQASDAVARQLRQLAAFRNARRIALYWPADGELEIWPILRDAWAAHKQVYLPCLDPLGSRQLRFRGFRADADMSTNRYGIPEPAPDNPAADLWSLDLVLLPLVAFDESGQRLGMGGGFYDATLGVLRHNRLPRRPRLLGLAHTCQQVDQLQTHAGDVTLDGIITPQRYFRGLGPTG